MLLFNHLDRISEAPILMSLSFRRRAGTISERMTKWTPLAASLAGPYSALEIFSIMDLLPPLNALSSVHNSKSTHLKIIYDHLGTYIYTSIYPRLQRSAVWL